MPGDPVERAFQYFEAGQYEEAVEQFSASLQAQPGDARAHRGRGLVYLQLQRWSLAAADFDSACHEDPTNLENWVELGISLSLDGKIYQALKVFETLLAREPRYVRGHLELGFLYLKLGAIPKGRQQLELALVCQPTPAQRQAIASVLREQARLDRKRLYRPDFEALHRQGSSERVPWARRVIARLFPARADRNRTAVDGTTRDIASRDER